MHPFIEGSQFGNITIANILYQHDVVIDLHGQVKKRKKKLSKMQYGTSHIVSLAEVKHIYTVGAERLVIGTGQTGFLTLSEDAEDYLRDNNCHVELLPTQQALDAWNNTEGDVIGMFHVTC